MLKVENPRISHRTNISTIIQSYSVATPDVCVITREGHTLYTNKVLLAMNSTMLAEMMVDNVREELINELKETAAEMGANAIVGLRMETNSVFDGVLDMVVTGTAIYFTK